MELVARSLVKRYPGVTALDDVSIELRGGEVHAIAGENGAGKSTLMAILSGAVRPDSGSISVDGVPVQFESPHAAQVHRIRMIHQELNLVPELTVAENIFLGAEPARRGVVDRGRQQREARVVLDRLGQTAIDPRARVADLPLSARQMTEIAKSVVRDAALLIMDEPTAILAHEETEALFAVIEQLRATGVAIAYISHRLDEIFRIAGRVTVLRDGHVVSTDAISALTREDIVRRMVGRELAGGYPGADNTAGDVLLRLDRVNAGPIHDVSLSLKRGEILGLVGLVGAGRTEVAHAIHGHLPITSGTMSLDGAPYRPRTPHDAILAGIGLLPEDRKGQGLILMAAIRENASLASLDALAHGGVVDRSDETRAVRRWAEALDLRTPNFERPARLLSGGNQQKVVLARWLLAGSRILLFDEPTRGIDVGAKAEIYALMRKLADQGTAILMISSDLPEALGMADRVLVMRSGRIVGELAARDATQERAMRLILGESAAA